MTGKFHFFPAIMTEIYFQDLFRGLMYVHILDHFCLVLTTDI